MPDQARELQTVPIARLLAADAAVASKNQVARTRHDGQLADDRRQGSAEPSLGPGRAGAFRQHSTVDRVRADRGDALRPAHAGDARPR